MMAVGAAPCRARRQWEQVRTTTGRTPGPVAGAMEGGMAREGSVLRLTVGKKIVAGIVLILAAGTLDMLVLSDGLGHVKRSMEQLAEVKEPISTATHEMEINVN